MKVRLTLRLASLAAVWAAAGGMLAACTGDDTTPGSGDASSGASSGSGSGSVSGSGSSISGSVSGAASGSTSGMDSSVGDSAGPDSTIGDGGVADAKDSGSTETGSADSTLGDTGTPDGTSTEAAAEAGAADTGATETGAADGGEAGAEGGGGPLCKTGPDGGINACDVGAHCCVNAATLAQSCQSACQADAGTFPIDCLGATGPGQCTATAGAGAVCCGVLALTGNQTDAGVCIPQGLVTQCAPPSACAENIPQDCSQAATTSPYVLRMCTATSDCTGDRIYPDGGPEAGIGHAKCCSFGAPASWCVDALTATAPTATCMP